MSNATRATKPRRRRARRLVERADRRPCTFLLDVTLVERARREIGESGVVSSIETALTAAIDYHHWVREVREGRRDALS
ncbi:MAG TPA: hypothetical protein VNZ57_12780 [Longimicrobiales bacterium]|nr:hypothetical protein [Longimicrobiales bacterium]